MANPISKDVLNAVKRKTGKNISPKDIQKVASTVGPSTVKSEQQLRALIKQVAKMAGVPVTESTIKELIAAIKKSGMNPGSLEAMIRSMIKK
jgi:uncharacterized protein YpuA (DUF1002 family)